MRATPHLRGDRKVIEGGAPSAASWATAAMCSRRRPTQVEAPSPAATLTAPAGRFRPSRVTRHSHGRHTGAGDARAPLSLFGHMLWTQRFSLASAVVTPFSWAAYRSDTGFPHSSQENAMNDATASQASTAHVLRFRSIFDEG